jgi:hypothetical protein
MDALILTILFLNSLAIIYAAVWQRRFAIDTARIGGAIAARLLDLYDNEIEVLSEDGVKRHARQKYLEYCGAFGLPETAVEAVTAAAWGIIEKAQEREPAIYE